MGINGLSGLIRQLAPQASFSLDVSELRGKRVAIDFSHWLHANLSIIQKKLVENLDLLVQRLEETEIRLRVDTALIDFIVFWVRNGITPVPVFDGISPEEKRGTKEERISQQNRYRQRIDEIYLELANNPQDSLIKELKKNLTNYHPITSEMIEHLKNLLSHLGIPYLRATGEAEKLCSALCLEGKVAAVFSVDTDNLVYGCPLMITKRIWGNNFDAQGDRVERVECLRVDYLRSGFGVTQSMLVDLSIMCGCDFNQKLKGYGEEALLNLILQYRSLDNFPSSYDLRPLNYQRCRELFGFCPSLELIMEPGDQTDFSFDLNRQSLITSRDYLECYGLDFLLTKLSASSHQLESSSDGWPLKLNLSAIPYYPPEIRKISPQFNLIIIPDSDDDWDPR